MLSQDVGVSVRPSFAGIMKLAQLSGSYTIIFFRKGKGKGKGSVFI